MSTWCQKLLEEYMKFMCIRSFTFLFFALEIFKSNTMEIAISADPRSSSDSLSLKIDSQMNGILSLPDEILYLIVNELIKTAADPKKLGQRLAYFERTCKKLQGLINRPANMACKTCIYDSMQSFYKTLVNLAKAERLIFIEDSDLNLKQTKDESIKQSYKTLQQKLSDEINDVDCSLWSLLMIAAQKGSLEVVEKILKIKDIDLNAQNNCGYSALMLASYNNQLVIVEELLKLKTIDITLKDLRGKTASDLARDRYNSFIVLSIEVHIAEKDFKPFRCGICWENVDSLDLEKKLNCGHTFHKDCVNLCLEKYARCPNCNEKAN